ncbi:hypothetical protein BH11PLA1_BH11PLA1_06910 [soil metagenome]
MAKHQNLSPHQQKIVNRFYDHKETIHLTKLQELSSDVLLAETPAAAAKLWKRIEDYLTKFGIAPEKIAAVVGGKDAAGLGKLVNDLSKVR